MRFRYWPGCEWCWPKYFNNFYREITVGKLSLFLGKGKTLKEWRR